MLPTASLAAVTPHQERLARGAVAIVECFQEIPCNPCATNCPSQAFALVSDINALPVLDWDKCIGCGICVACCPGLAIFIVDGSGEQGVVRLPYEFLPLPEVGATVLGVGRDGAAVCGATVLRVQNSPAQDRTPIIWLQVPPEHIMSVRHFKF
ncbi:MAG: 4Fe-4S binding protein [Symbiobacteriaceae bacterium]|nr:4Fe-4S binding protein [Symbiobacteriaceae bacterium]